MHARHLLEIASNDVDAGGESRSVSGNRGRNNGALEPIGFHCRQEFLLEGFKGLRSKHIQPEQTVGQSLLFGVGIEIQRCVLEDHPTHPNQ